MSEWLEIAVRTTDEWTEIISNILMEAGAGGVAIEDPALGDFVQENSWDKVPSSGFALVKAYFPSEDAEKAYDFVLNSMKKAGFSDSCLETCRVAEEDWANAWKAFYKPVKIGNKLVVKPTWEDYSAGEEDIVVEMDPGMAFGSGTHATTSLCLEIIEKVVRPGDIAIDVGTGSGILSITMALMGASRVTAIDSDPVCVRVAKENVRHNGVDSIVKIMEGNLLDDIHEKSDIVVANILSNVIREIAPDAARVVREGGYFIASGINYWRLPGVKSVVENAGFVVEEVLEKEHWTGILARRLPD